MKEQLKKIIRQAEREKFGRGNEASWQKRNFIMGVQYALERIEGGKEALAELDYTPLTKQD